MQGTIQNITLTETTVLTKLPVSPSYYVELNGVMLRMLFVAGKNTPAYMGSLDSLHWIDVKSTNGGRHQVGFDPEVHKVNRTLALCL